MVSNPNPPAQKLLELAARAIGAGQFAEAEDHLQQVLLHDPENAVALHHLGLRAYLRGETEDARRLIERALAADPNSLEILTSYATLLHEVGQPKQALDVFLRVLAMNNTLPEIWNGAGICLQETGQHAQAIEFYLKAMALRPEFAEAHSNLAAVLVQEGDANGAIEHLRHALAIDPTLAVAHSNLGIALRGRFEYAAAIASLQEALRLTPGHPDVLSNLGEVLSLVYDDAAEDMLRQSMELRPHDPEKHWNLALELLKRGNYTEGFREHEWRWQRPKQPSGTRRFTHPFWRGEPGQQIAGNTILLHAEQGFGDTIQFLRYVPLVLAQGARVVLVVQPPLVRLAQQFAAQHEGVLVVGESDPMPPPFDWHTPLMSLPLAFGTTPETVPSPVRLTPPPEPPTHATPRAGPLRVGITWAGNPKHDRDLERTIPTAALLPLLATPNITWVSLQVGPPIAELTALGVSIQQPPLRDFLDTANVIDTLDLVISVDSAVAHLAATQGIPTWVLLPYVGDWRWLRPDPHTGVAAQNPWYPHARLFRQREMPSGQPQTELWAPILAEVAHELRTSHMHPIKTLPR